MITLKSFKDRVATLSEQADPIVEAARKNNKDYPPTLLLKRKAIRVFPNGRRVAMYYADAIEKAIAIPYSTENDNEIPVVEEVVTEAAKPKAKAKPKKKKKVVNVSANGQLSNLTKLKQIATEKNTGMLKFEDGSSVRVDAMTAKAIHRVHSLVNDENKIKFERMINKDKHNFHKVSSFAAGFHAQLGDDGKKKTTK